MSDPPEPRPGTERYRCGRLELQPAARRLLVDGREARVGARAFDVLLALVERPGRVVGKEELLAAVWPGVVVEEANLAVQVSALRKLLGSGLIATVAGRGYQFTGRLEALPPVPADTRAQAPPRAPTPMLGRAAELAALSGLLAQQRLLTVTGPGGIGKTRLAQAWCEGPGAGEPVAWIDLGAIGDAVALRAALPPATADATTWIIDNAEALAGALAEVLPPLLAAAPRLRLLVTSQVPLQLQGEQVFRLGTLPVPPPRATPAQALRHSAVQLFVERARAADPRFELAAGNVSSVVAICRRLDGLPLALELAAARVATIGVNALAAALEAALDAADGDLGGLALLGTASRDKPERQRTLKAALAWSHALLDLQSQRLFRRLGVFAGGFTLAAAQAVVGDDAGDAWSVMNTLGRLVEHSLVARDGGEPPRFRLLDAARLFALAQLERAQEGAEWRARHLAWCLMHLQALHGDPGAPLSAAARAAIAAEAPNWRAALEQAFAPGSRRHEDGARLVAALQPYWRQTGADDEARRWSARAAAAAAAATAEAQPAAAPAESGPAFAAIVEQALAAAQQAAARGETAAAARRIDAALAELGALQARWLEQAAAARRRLLEAGLQQALQERDAAAAAARIEALAALDAPAAPTEAAVFLEPCAAAMARGRSRGELFDLELAAQLLQRRFAARPAGAGQRALGVELLEALNGVQRAGGEPALDPLPLAEALLQQTPLADEPATWAALQHERARALGHAGARAASLPQLLEAIAACEQALQGRPQARQPDAWADSMALLASLQGRAALLETGTARLQAAVAAGRASLQRCTRAQRPLEWARTQCVIGVALSEWARREGTTQRHHEAVAAFRAALGELEPAQQPRLWLMAQTNLAIDLAAIGEADPGPDGLEALQSAVDAYRSALRHMKAERMPGPWAATQHNLGGALRLIGEREAGTQSLREAALAFAAALEHHTRERAPQHWAAGQNDRALALLALGRREQRLAPIEEAVAALRAALLERRRESAPLLWARSSADLAEALLALGELGAAPAAVQEALATAEAVLGAGDAVSPEDRQRLPALIAQARGWLAAQAPR